MNFQLINIIFPLLFLGYQIIIDFVNLFPFNDIDSRDKRLRKFEVMGNYPPPIIIALCFYSQNTVFMWIGFGITFMIFIMHLLSWWIPYFTGRPKKMKEDYEKYFTRTYKCLPKIKDHLVPDVEHMGVGVLVIAMLIFQLLELL